MIPLPLSYIKLGIGVVLALVCAALAWVVLGWKRKADELPLVQAQLAEAVMFLDQYEKDIRTVLEASHGYQEELAALRTAAIAERLPVVRVCKPAGKAKQPVSAPVSRPDAAGPASGVLPPAAEVQAGPDIGPGLFADADRADELSAQVRGLQAYALACSK